MKSPRPRKQVKSPVTYVPRNGAKDKSADSFSPQTGQPLKLHHKLAGMK